MLEVEKDGTHPRLAVPSLSNNKRTAAASFVTTDGRMQTTRSMDSPEVRRTRQTTKSSIKPYYILCIQLCSNRYPRRPSLQLCHYQSICLSTVYIHFWRCSQKSSPEPRHTNVPNPYRQNNTHSSSLLTLLLACWLIIIQQQKQQQ